MTTIKKHILESKLRTPVYCIQNANPIGCFIFLMKGLEALFDAPSEFTETTPILVFLSLTGVRLFRVLISVWLSIRYIDRHMPMPHARALLKKLFTAHNLLWLP
ncbi:MAG: hypothetical protein K8R40_10715 [Anaerolineaceae bacterium]|nr:hypothetical protein [Anaerolineaceae bacterium]